MAENTPFLIGAHMSIAGGVYNAIYRGDTLGCTAVQVFTRSNRQWSFDTTYTQEEKQKLAQALADTGVSSVTSHAAYLINIGAAKPDVEDKSVRALAAELQRCGELDIPYVVFHPGSYTGGDKQTSMQRIAQNIEAIMQDAPDNVTLLLENMAGQGSQVGNTFEELATICDQIRNTKNIGFCFDTCHAFAIGYEFDTQEKYEQMWQSFDQYLGLDRLKVIHLNDSQKQGGSCVDRHEHIGKGRMGITPFKHIMNDERFFQTPKILETPKDHAEDDVRNLQTLYNVLTDQHKQKIRVYFPKKQG